MNILVFSEFLYPHGSGAELATWLYLNALAKKGFKITIITRLYENEPTHEIVNNEINIIRLPMQNLAVETRYDTLVNSALLCYPFIHELVRDSDIIYVPASWYGVIPLAKAYKKPVIVHLHNYIVACPTSYMYDFTKNRIGQSCCRSFMVHEKIKRSSAKSVVASSLMNQFLGKPYSYLGSLADAVVFVSQAQSDLITSKIPKLRRKGYMIHNPIPDRPLIKAEHTGVGYFGGKRIDKGFPVLLQAIESRPTGCPPFSIYLTNSKKTGSIRTIHNNALHYFPRLIQTEFYDFMKQLSTVTLPSLWPEPLPYTLIESMLYGKLIVASNVGGIPEIVNDSVLGVKLVAPGSHSELLDALCFFRQLKLDQINEIGEKNREYVLKRFDNDKSVASLIDLFDRVA